MQYSLKVSISSIKVHSGMSLVISLIFLLIVSLAGMTVLNVSTVEEKMAGGTRDKDLAFQAAEIALKRAEERIQESLNGSAGFTSACTDGLCATPLPSNTQTRWTDPDYCGAGQNIWSCNKSKSVDVSTLSSGTFHKNPRYIIESLRAVNSGGASLVIQNAGDITASNSRHIYRITAIGYGGSGSAKALLQSTYGKAL